MLSFTSFTVIKTLVELDLDCTAESLAKTLMKCEGILSASSGLAIVIIPVLLSMENLDEYEALSDCIEYEISALELASRSVAVTVKIDVPVKKSKCKLLNTFLYF